ncbi:SHOCT domain-containing protein [Natrarchaeobius chitinivorans]|uniref:SHOCT domain-containing protein n=1 Tax=Natrarchaeobius chitinivorans TaxID=1679083 RepID=UPI0026B89756
MMAVAWPMMGLWGGGHMWTDGTGNGFGAVASWLAIWIPLVVVVFAGTYLLYRITGSDERRDRDEALEELRLAYARGDLTDEEFTNRRERLQREK